MNKLSLLAIGGLAVSLAGAASASTYNFKNIGAFTASGSMTVTVAAVSVPCQAQLTGMTKADGAASITGATFSGATCIAVSPAGLPWSLTAKAKHAITIGGVTVEATIIGICGPGDIDGKLNHVGVISFTGAGLPSSLGVAPCAVSGTFDTSPRLKIKAQP